MKNKIVILILNKLHPEIHRHFHPIIIPEAVTVILHTHPFEVCSSVQDLWLKVRRVVNSFKLSICKQQSCYCLTRQLFSPCLLFVDYNGSVAVWMWDFFAELACSIKEANAATSNEYKITNGAFPFSPETALLSVLFSFLFHVPPVT